MQCSAGMVSFTYDSQRNPINTGSKGYQEKTTTQRHNNTKEKNIMNATTTTETFTCHFCGEEKPVHKEGGTGYARTAEGHLVCYPCCGKRDAEQMNRESRITLYLTGDTITNWPGTLKMKARYVKKGRHNMAGTRHDAWFTDPHGNAWRGTQYGENTQLIHCRKLK